MFGPITLARFKSFDVSVSVIHDDVVIMIPYPEKIVNAGILATVYSSTVDRSINLNNNPIHSYTAEIHIYQNKKINL